MGRVARPPHVYGVVAGVGCRGVPHPYRYDLAAGFLAGDFRRARRGFSWRGRRGASARPRGIGVPWNTWTYTPGYPGRSIRVSSAAFSGRERG